MQPEIAQATTDMPVEPGFAKIREAAQFLGLSLGTVNKMIHQGRIPAKRYGRVFRIPWAWLRAQAGE
jgi:excisionase family DNA binding protein